jgi:hypothetical protein
MRMCGHPLVLYLQFPGMPAVIRIEESEVRLCCLLPACVSGTPRPAVGAQAYYSDRRLVLINLLQALQCRNGFALIVTAIFHQQNFLRRPCLHDHRCHRASYGFRAAITGNNDTHRGWH